MQSQTSIGPESRRLLLVDDDDDIREALSDSLGDAGFEVATAASGPEALSLIDESAFDAVISDVHMEPMSGDELMDALRRRCESLPIVLMTAYGTIEQAVNSMRDGASHYLVKPFDSGVLTELIDRICPGTGRLGDPVAVDPLSRELLRNAALVADSDAVVTLSGESGTGKEVVARYIHDRSPRGREAFVAINCAAIPENMLEAILFGHVKGAYTGALRDTPGKFEQAQRGTLLLDEVTEMAPELQAKLLRVLQESEVERIGAVEPVALDVRVIATTNRDLREEVAHGRFREDLYYRLNVFPLTVPALRARRGDILPLVRHVIAARQPGTAPDALIGPGSAEALLDYSWPGNVRELENVIQRALILSRGGPIVPEHLALEQQHRAGRRGGSDANDLQEAVQEREHTVIMETLRRTRGNRTAAAEQLGISPRTLRYKLARLRRAGVQIPRSFRDDAAPASTS